VSSGTSSNTSFAATTQQVDRGPRLQRMRWVPESPDTRRTDLLDQVTLIFAQSF
jgi:hypothetical protein